MSKKISCGGFYIDENDFNISEEGELSLKPTEASSLSDLSDVDISKSSLLYDGDVLLRFNTETEKWENVRIDKALLGYYHSDDPGVLTMDDVGGGISVSSGISINTNTDSGRVFLQLLAAAIAYGQYQQDDLDPRMFRPIIDRAIRSASYNSNSTFAAVDTDQDDFQCFQLVGVSNEFAVWSGVIINDVKFYRITFVILCPDNTTPASIIVKAEELMTYTEPTQTP